MYVGLWPVNCLDEKVNTADTTVCDFIMLI